MADHEDIFIKILQDFDRGWRVSVVPFLAGISAPSITPVQ
jgi:hypothetical protein